MQQAWEVLVVKQAAMQNVLYPFRLAFELAVKVKQL